jgi:hypothetical protein
VTIRDPLTGKTMFKLVKMRLPLKGFRGDVINLGKFMEQGLKNPDFGFDTVDLDPVSNLFYKPASSLQLVCAKSSESGHFQVCIKDMLRMRK